MMRSMISAAALAGLLALGCDEQKAPEAPKTDSTVGGMMDKAKEATGTMADKAKETGAAAVDKAKEMAPDLTKAVEDIYNKAKSAIDGGKLDEAKGYVEQLKPYLDKVPAEWKTKIETLIKDYTAKAAANLPKMGG